MKRTVVIVGSGAGGLILALTLVRFRIQPLIIEKSLARSDFTKAITLQSRSLEIINGLGLIGQLLSKGHPVNKSSFYTNGIFVGAIDYTTLPSKFNCLLTIAQP